MQHTNNGGTSAGAGSQMRRTLGWLAVASVLMALTASCGTSVDNSLEVDATVNGVELADGDRTDPIGLSPEDPARLELSVTNPTSADLNVRHIRLEGQVLEMRFAHANTAVDFTLGAGESRDIAFDVDFFDLGEQVTGHIDANLSLHDEEREPLYSEQFFVDVDGASSSSLGVTLLMVALFAGISLLVNLLGVARGTLPSNRWYRAVRFAFTGLTIALFVMLILPFVGLWLPPMGAWLPGLAGGAMAGFLLGYLSPGDDDDDDELDLSDDRILAKAL